MPQQYQASQTIAAARRGQIIQHVLVDGWSVREAAQTFDLDEQRVARWVADYRRRGMASLHNDETGIETLLARAAFWLRGVLASSLWRHPVAHPQVAPCVLLRRTGDAGRTQP
jgi:hypothetical protein